jgi:hypothetical protein
MNFVRADGRGLELMSWFGGLHSDPLSLSKECLQDASLGSICRCESAYCEDNSTLLYLTFTPTIFMKTPSTVHYRQR